MPAVTQLSSVRVTMKSLFIVALFISAAYAVRLPASIVHHLKPGPVVQDKPMARIAGGNYASNGQFPFQVSVTVEGGRWHFSVCGGTLIAHEWVLTAANCVDGKPEYIEIGLGSVKKDKPLQTRYASEVYINPNWNSINLDGDIALVKIARVDYNDRIAPAALPARNGHHSTYVNSKVTVSGWGFINEEGDLTNDLQYTDLKVIKNSVCSENFGSNAGDPTKICVATWESAPCGGDTGGPLVIESSRLLIGVTSYGGCLLGYPVGFTRVTSYLDWIHSVSGVSA